MSRDASGVYTGPANSVNPAVEGEIIDEADFNALVDDLEAAMTESVFTAGSSSTDNSLMRADGTSGRKVQESQSGAVTLDDSNNIAGVNNLTMDGYIDVAEISTPANPAADTIRIYAVDNASASELHFVDSAGNDVNLSNLSGTVTSIAYSAPAAGLTISGGTITSSGTWTFALADDLAGLEAITGNGIVARTAADTYATRVLTGPAAGITVTDGSGVSGNPTLALANDLSALEGLGSTGFAVRSAADTWVQRDITASGAGLAVTNGDGVSGSPNIALDDDMAAIEALSGNGFAVRTAADTWAQRVISTTGDGIAITDGSGVSGNPSIVLDDDAAAVEALSGTGLATRTASNTWTTRIVAAGSGIAVTNGSAVAGNPTIAQDVNGLTSASAFVSGDKLVIYDTSAGGHRKIDFDDLPGSSSGILNGYASVTDGTTTANASGADTFKFRAGSGLSTTVGSNDATHGDNVLIEVSGLDDAQVAAAGSATNYTPGASTVDGHLSGIDTALGALDDADIAAAGSATNYTPGSSTVDGHLSGIDTALGTKATISGTPANNRVAIWTGTTDIEGDADLTFDGTDLTVGGDVNVGASIYVTEAASAAADTAGDGQLWVRNDAPNTLMFTDDAGNDCEIAFEGECATNRVYGSHADDASVLGSGAAGYNIASTADYGTGNYGVTIDNDFDSALWSMTGAIRATGASDLDLQVYTPSNTAGFAAPVGVDFTTPSLADIFFCQQIAGTPA